MFVNAAFVYWWNRERERDYSVSETCMTQIQLISKLHHFIDGTCLIWIFTANSDFYRLVLSPPDFLIVGEFCEQLQEEKLFNLWVKVRVLSVNLRHQEALTFHKDHLKTPKYHVRSQHASFLVSLPLFPVSQRCWGRLPLSFHAIQSESSFVQTLSLCLYMTFLNAADNETTFALRWSNSVRIYHLKADCKATNETSSFAWSCFSTSHDIKVHELWRKSNR